MYSVLYIVLSTVMIAVIFYFGFTMYTMQSKGLLLSEITNPLALTNEEQKQLLRFCTTLRKKNKSKK